jgi:hypothetical protein
VRIVGRKRFGGDDVQPSLLGRADVKPGTQSQT